MNTSHDVSYSLGEHSDKVSWLLENVIQLPFAALFLGFAVLGFYFAWRQWGKHTIKLNKVAQRNAYLSNLHGSLDQKQETLLYGLGSEFKSTIEKLQRREHHVKELHYRLALKEEEIANFDHGSTNEEALQSEVDSLRTELDELAQEHDQLKADKSEVEEKYADRLQELNDELTANGNKLEQLRQNLNAEVSSDEVEQLKAKLKAKDKQIGKLEGKLKSKDKQIAKLDKSIETEAARNEVEISSWEGRSNSLMLDLSDRDRLIMELREQITELSNQPAPAEAEESSLFVASEIYVDDRLGVVYRSRPDEIDDLKEISGVASVLEEKLHNFGIYQFKQIAIWTDEQIIEFGERLTFKDRIDRDMWVNQAVDLHFDKYGEHLTPQAAIYRKPESKATPPEEKYIDFRREENALAAFQGEQVESHDRFGVVYTEAPTDSDDLKQIKGVGKTLEKALHEFGVYRFKQIALWSPRVINEFVEDLPFGDRVTRDCWTEQALQLHEQKYGEKVN